MGLMALLWILTILVPIHGAFWFGARRERVRTRRLLLMYWKLRGGRRS